MPSEREQSILLRQFSGVDIAHDPAFLDPSILQSSENWVPDLAWLLSKRLGYGNFQTNAGGKYNSQLLGQYGASDGFTLLLVEVAASAAIGGVSGVTFYKSTGGSVTPTSPTGHFSDDISMYGAAALGGSVYIGNGHDPIKRVTLNATLPVATDLTALGTTNTTGSGTALVADTTSLLDNGTYSYAWAVYNTTTKLLESRGVAQQVVLNGARSRVTFTAPNGVVGNQTTGTALPAGRVYKLFVALRNLPVELGTDQVPKGLAEGGTWDMSAVGVDGPQIPLVGGVTRTGKFLVSHRGRIWMAGDLANPSKVYATSFIVPGLEEAIYNQGDFYPADAVLNVGLNDGDSITGIAVAATTETARQPTSPFIIFKNTSTWVLLGDITNDPSATLFQLSSRVGCVSHRTIATTPFGVIFCGQESVYLINPQTLVPVDIGEAIAPDIKSVPVALRSELCAMYHKGFYKIAFGMSGDSSNFSLIPSPG